MSNLHAALGLAQFEDLPAFLKKKKSIALRYRELLFDYVKNNVLSFQAESEDACSNYWLNVIMRTPQANKETTEPWRPLFEHFQKHNIQTRPLWRPMHKLPPHRDLQVIGGATAETLCRHGLCLPSSVTLTPEQQERVVSVLQKGLE